MLLIILSLLLDYLFGDRFSSTKSKLHKLIFAKAYILQMDSIEQKQALLRKEILEAGIDPQEFVGFLGGIKNEGENVDLENWTLEELQKAIVQFKEDKAQMKSEMSKSRLGKDTKKSKIFESIKKEKVFYDNTGLWDYQLYESQECSKADVQFKLAKGETPKITIEKCEIKSVGGFIFGIGSRNELNITISTNFTDNRVVRKGEDADWLRNILMVTYPGFFIPPLEEDRELNSDDHKGIEKRKDQIEVFLNKLMSFDIFHHSRHAQAFFEEDNPKKFTQFRNRQAYFETVRDVETVQTPNGTFSIEISDNMNKLLKHSSQLGDSINGLYNEMTHCCAKIVTHMQKTDKYVKELNVITIKLNEKYTECQKILKMQELKLPTIYLSFSNIVNNTNKNLKRHIKAFYDFYETFVREVNKDWGQFLNNDAKVQKETKKYLYEKEALLKKKERYVSDPLKWQIPQAEYMQLKNKDLAKMTKEEKFSKMFPSDNENQNRLKLWVAYVNQNYKESFKAFLVQQENFLINKYIEYSGEATCLNKDMISNFTEFNQMIFA